MSRIDVRCANGHDHEVVRPIADWPKTPVCPTCGDPTEQMILPATSRSAPDPVVVFKAPDGSFRFPGDPNGLSAAKYAKSGYERLELRGSADVRRFESQMTKQERSIAARKVEKMQQHREMRETQNRGQLRQLMQSMTPFGRAVARAAMRRNDDKPREHTKDPNFVVEAYSFDRSNRDVSRDPDGRRRRD